MVQNEIYKFHKGGNEIYKDSFAWVPKILPIGNLSRPISSFKNWLNFDKKLEISGRWRSCKGEGNANTK